MHALRVCAVIAAVLTVLAILLYSTLHLSAPLLQRRLVFMPCGRHPGPPPSFTANFPGVRWTELQLDTADGERLSGVFLSSEHDKAPAPTPAPQLLTIFFHGTAMSVAENAPHAVQLMEPLRSSVLLVDYRGFGASSGSPTPAGLFADGEAMLREALHRVDFDPRRIVLHGFSLGCAVALHVAVTGGDGFAGLVLEAPFVDMRSPTLFMFPFLRPLGRFMDPMFRNVPTAMALRHTPLLVVHATDDEVIPYRDGRTVYAAANARSKAFFTSQASGHLGRHLHARPMGWLQQTLQVGSSPTAVVAGQRRL